MGNYDGASEDADGFVARETHHSVEGSDGDPQSSVVAAQRESAAGDGDDDPWDDASREASGSGAWG